MANFRTHLVGGFAISGALGLTAYKAGLVDSREFLICVLIGTVGSLLPDIDADNSGPVRLGLDLISLILAFFISVHFKSSLSLMSLLLFWLLLYYVIRYAFFATFTRTTLHRGMIHSVPFIVLLSLILIYFSYFLFHIPSITSWFYGTFLFIGMLLHLILDEASSVNLVGETVQRSSGTAMTLYQGVQQRAYLGLYLLVIILLFFAPPFLPFWEKLTDPITWWLLRDSLYPTELVRYCMGVLEGQQ